MSAVVGVGALRIIDGVGHFYREQFFPPGVVDRFVELAERDGLVVPAHGGRCDHDAVLDLYDSAGDIIGDRCVPDERAWNAVNSELRLEVFAIEGEANA